MRMTGSAAEAEDLTQDAFVQVLSQAINLPWRLLVFHLAHCIAVNTVLMKSRVNVFAPCRSMSDSDGFLLCAGELRHDDPKFC